MAEHPTGIKNWRDLGGLRTMDGAALRHGSVFRSAELSATSEQDLTALAILGVGPVFDLRTAAERRAAPDVLPPSARSLHLDVFADKNLTAVPTKMMEFLSSPEAVGSALGGSAAMETMLQNYREMVTLDSASQALTTMVRLLIEDPRPALVHCTSGKDRTGWAAAVVLFAVGADEATVFTDYLRTNDLYLPALAPVFAQFEAGGGDPELLRALLGVREEYLRAAVDQAVRTHGSIDAYLHEALGIGPDERAALRARLLVS